MIAGHVNSKLDAVVKLGIADSDGSEHKTNFVIDTGFNGYVTLPRSAIKAMELPWQCRQQGFLADGSSILFDVYIARIKWDGTEDFVEVEAADTDPLIGMALLEGHKLIVDVRNGGRVEIEKSQ
jgi:clan AA aspartic protease